MNKLYQLLLMLFPVILLTACETAPKESTQSVEWQIHQDLLVQIDSFQASGKLGYISPETKQSLNFIWKHSPGESQLRLTSFLGKTVLNLTMTPEGAKVTDIDGNEYQDNDATLLVYKLTGLNIPVSYMQDWLKGLPTAADSFELKRDTNTLSTLSKSLGTQNWNLKYISYQSVNGIPLPYAMNLTQSDTLLKIVVSKWKI